MEDILTFLLCLTFSSLFHPIQGFAITGVAAGVNITTGERPFRRDVNELYMSGPAWDLYILSLRRFQSARQDDPLSYFQIASIHGLPRAPWDSVSGQESPPGFCVHGAPTFLTWHRPYLALFEQILWQHAQDIAQTYPASSRENYVSAAETLRIPYWDAFANASLPLAVTLPNVMVDSPGGREMVDNPLFNYAFHLDEAPNPFPRDHWAHTFPTTVRHFNQSTSRSDLGKVAADLQAQFQSNLELTYRLFSSESDYSRMSTSASGGNNFESVHNTIHNAVGGWGHMTDPATSSFEPIFWLHHANIDRILAMWQAIYPTSFVVPSVNQIGTYAMPRGFTETGDTSLLPFHSDDDGRFWTSNKSRFTRTFGYTYQDVVDWNISPSDLVDRVRGNVNRLYQAPPGKKRKTIRWGNAPARRLVPDVYEDATSDWQWTINVQVRRDAHPSPFVLDFFIGKPPSAPPLWSNAPNLVGSYVQFISMPARKAASEPQGSRVLSYGQVGLTYYLRERANEMNQKNLSPKIFVVFLKNALVWRARDMKGCELDFESLAELSITVSSQVVRSPKATNKFPTYGNLVVHEDITRGKPGGFCS